VIQKPLQIQLQVAPGLRVHKCELTTKKATLLDVEVNTTTTEITEL
jgi:hypothetical protein